MKMAQMMAAIPDLLPPDSSAELPRLPAEAPADEPGLRQAAHDRGTQADSEKPFRTSSSTPAASASLGQIHKAVAPDGTLIACKLEYPDMESEVEADLGQLGIVFELQRRFRPEIEHHGVAGIRRRLRGKSISPRAKTGALFRLMLEKRGQRARAGEHTASCRPTAADHELAGWARSCSPMSTRLSDRDAVAKALSPAWWKPFATFGVVHRGPRLGK